MNAHHQHVIAAIKKLAVWPDHAFVVQQQLGDGPTNETWLVTCHQERYVLRLVKSFAASMSLALDHELAITRVAEQHSLTAPVVASDVAKGIVLSRYLEGRTWTLQDLHDNAQLNRLAHTLRRLHSLDCEARRLDLPSAIQNYAQRSADRRAHLWVDTILAQLDRISPRASVVCHNDINLANIIDDGQLYLIDWEYAALGDPLFDVAVVVSHHQLDVNTAHYLLDAYLGCSDADAQTDLAIWCTVYQNLLALWLSALEADPATALSQQQAQQLERLRIQLR